MFQLRAALLFACLSGAIVACSVYTEDLLEEASGGGGSGADGGGSATGGSSSSSAAGGSAAGGSAAGGRGSGGMLGQPGEACGDPAECASMQCVDGVCCDSACDGLCERCDISGSEGSCNLLAAGDDPDAECGADSCNGAGQCSCQDGMQSGQESAQDCGGPVCMPCADGLTCNMPSDCVSGVCAVTCQPPSCSDNVQNGDETDSDCGGSCPGCADGLGCIMGSDCVSGVCVGNSCQPPVCGDTVTNGSEQCDDGNTDDFDMCPSSCLNAVSHLLISEFVVGPTAAEFVEIYNPTNATVSLNNVYLADFNTYYLVTSSSASPNSADFIVEFPLGSTIAAQGFVVVSLESATDFQAAYGMAPDFDFDPADMGALAMSGQIGSTAGLTNSDEMLVLFSYSSGPTVQDLDYVVYGNTSDAMDKTGIGAYLPDTPIANQITASAPASGASSHRCDSSEATETKMGGNGSSGHDETSESGVAAFSTLATPTPKAAPPMGFCP